VCAPNPDMLYYGYQAHVTRRYTARHNLDDALDAFRAKFGREPRFCLTHPTFAVQIGDAPADLRIEAVTWALPVGVMYVGDEEGI
jgi:hypothetical protein